MRIYVNGKIYDANDTAIVLIFEDDQEREQHANNLTRFQRKEGRRLYATFNQETPPDVQDIFDKIDLALKEEQRSKEFIVDANDYKDARGKAIL